MKAVDFDLGSHRSLTPFSDIALASSAERVTPDSPLSPGDTINIHRTPALATEAVQEWVRSRLSAHLVPKYVFWVNEYPKTPSGKIQKYKLQEQAKEILKMVVQKI